MIQKQNWQIIVKHSFLLFSVVFFLGLTLNSTYASPERATTRELLEEAKQQAISMKKAIEGYTAGTKDRWWKSATASILTTINGVLKVLDDGFKRGLNSIIGMKVNKKKFTEVVYKSILSQFTPITQEEKDILDEKTKEIVDIFLGERDFVGKEVILIAKDYKCLAGITTRVLSGSVKAMAHSRGLAQAATNLAHAAPTAASRGFSQAGVTGKISMALLAYKISGFEDGVDECNKASIDFAEALEAANKVISSSDIELKKLDEDINLNQVHYIFDRARILWVYTKMASQHLKKSLKPWLVKSVVGLAGQEVADNLSEEAGFRVQQWKNEKSNIQLQIKKLKEDIRPEPSKEITITFPQIKVAKHNIEDILGTLALTKNDLNNNGELEIKGRVDDGANGANIEKVQIDVGEGWINLDSRVNLRYKFRPEENREYRLRFRAIDSAGKEHESIFGTIRLTYSSVDDEALIREVVYDSETAYQNEDINKYMSYLADDYWNKDGQFDKGTEWTINRNDFKDYDPIGTMKISDLKITLQGNNKARARFRLYSVRTETDTGLQAIDDGISELDLEKRNGKWLIVTERGKDSVDNSAPRIVSITPADGATGVSTTTPIVIRFSEPMGYYHIFGFRGITGGQVSSSNYAFSSYDTNTYTFTFSNVTTLPSGETYQIEVQESFRDAYGNSVEPIDFTFTTQ
ncbi:MAG: Ig-like domain-containing protein [Candidatus Omnitrophota bacterium]